MSDTVATPLVEASDRRLPLVRRMAWLCAALMLATITLSAFMRLSQAGLDCADWPACYGQNLRTAPQHADATASHTVAIARLAHRAVASATLLLVFVLVMTTLATRPVLRRAGALSAALLVLALSLAALGIATPGARLPAVAMGNLLGGLAMLALCWRLVAGAAPATTAPAHLGAGAIISLIILCVQLASGALVSTSYAALSCADLRECIHLVDAAHWDWQVLNPWREPVFAATPAPINADAALALLAHRIGAAVALPTLALLGIAAWRRGRRFDGLALLVLAAVQLGLGLLVVATGLPLFAVLLHNLAAALLLATLVRLI